MLENHMMACAVDAALYRDSIDVATRCDACALSDSDQMSNRIAQYTLDEFRGSGYVFNSHNIAQNDSIFFSVFLGCRLCRVCVRLGSLLLA